MEKAPLAVVTGGSRGLGFETARQLGTRGYRLVIAAKDKKRLAAAEAILKSEGHDVRSRSVDMASKASISAFGKFAATLGPIAILVNAAGILPEHMRDGVLGAADDAVAQTLAINALGPWRLCKVIAPHLAANARVVNVSSGMGALSDMGSAYFGYRASKAALNVLTIVLSKELAPRGMMVNSVCPGWVKTDMGGASATRSVEEGSRGIVWAATLPPGGPSGGFFRDGHPIAW